MLRVIAGTMRGKKLSEFTGDDIRPITDLAKGALFSILFDRVIDADFLDIYAGTGCVGIEAISRGAASATFIDSSRESIKIIKKNLELTKFTEKATVINGLARNALLRLNKKFHFIFLDPPFFEEIDNEVLNIIDKNEILLKGGEIILKHFEKTVPPDCFEKIKLRETRRYGNSKLSFYGYES
ncbi:MAG: 16S rRNA (guanine(966)-N(2))-methyltransferase RsmD [Candidatus Wallbacteria bacterium]